MATETERCGGHIRLWWTASDGQACDEIESFPDGATFDELLQATNAFWAEADGLREHGAFDYPDGEVTAELDGEILVEF